MRCEEGVFPPHWGWSLGRGSALLPENFLDFASQITSFDAFWAPLFNIQNSRGTCQFLNRAFSKPPLHKLIPEVDVTVFHECHSVVISGKPLKDFARAYREAAQCDSLCDMNGRQLLQETLKREQWIVLSVAWSLHAGRVRV